MAIRTTAPKIFLRGRRFYIRIQVPKALQADIGRKEVWKSLGTNDHEEAIARALDVTKEHRNEFALQLRRKQGRVRAIETLTEQQRMDIAREAFDLHLRKLEKTRDELQANDQHHWSELVELHRSELRSLEIEVAREGSRHDFVESLTNDILDYNLLSMAPDSAEFNQLGRMVAEAAINAQRTFVSRLEGHHVPENPDPRFIDITSGEVHSYSSVGLTGMDDGPGGYSIVVLAKRYVESPHKSRTPKTKLALQGYLDVASSILGPSKDVRTIENNDCLHFVDVVRRLPPNASKLRQFEGKTFEQIADLAERDGLTPLSPTGINNYVRTLYAFLNWCAGHDFISRVPMKWELLRVHDPVAAKDKRLPFTSNQLQTLFLSEIYTSNQRDSALFWVPLIALWNGMRANEICQRDVADVQVVEGHPVFDISHLADGEADTDKKTKTQSSVRVVPIHPKLISFGFMDFHHSREGQSKLFRDISIGADGYYSTTFSKKINRYLKRIGVHGQKRKFHSLRHNFRDALRRGSVNPSLAKELGGWTRGKSDAFEVYGAGYEIGQLREAIERVGYPDVDFDHLVVHAEN